jgi:hypothetical protein
MDKNWNKSMNTDILPAIGGAIGLISFLVAMGYTGYWAWFHPEKFKEREAGRVKKWWPFANYFRQYHGSDGYLWAARIGPIIFLLIFLFLGVLGILGFLGFIP